MYCIYVYTIALCKNIYLPILYISTYIYQYNDGSNSPAHHFYRKEKLYIPCYAVQVQWLLKYNFIVTINKYVIIIDVLSKVRNPHLSARDTPALGRDVLSWFTKLKSLTIIFNFCTYTI